MKPKIGLDVSIQSGVDGVSSVSSSVRLAWNWESNQEKKQEVCLTLGLAMDVLKSIAQFSDARWSTQVSYAENKKGLISAQVDGSGEKLSTLTLDAQACFTNFKNSFLPAPYDLNQSRFGPSLSIGLGPNLGKWAISGGSKLYTKEGYVGSFPPAGAEFKWTHIVS